MRNILLGTFLLSLALIAAPAGRAGKTEGGKRPGASIDISAFTVKDDVEVPRDILEKLREKIPERLNDTKKFGHIFIHERSSVDEGAPTLKMTGTIVEFDSGNRVERYLVGFGAGEAKLVAHVKFTNIATGQMVFEQDVTGKFRKGKYGGASIGVADQLAKEIARVVKRESF